MENNEKKKGGIKNVIFIILAIIIMAGVASYLWYYMDESKYFKTENAKVSATLYSVTSTTPGKLVKLTVEENDDVKANEIIGRVENGSYLKSPVNGKVLDCNVSLGQTVSTGATIAVIADVSDVCVKANIEETDINKISEGQMVIVELDAHSGNKFKGHVKSVDKMTQTALSGNATSFSTSGTYTKTTQLIPVKIAIDDDIPLDNIIGTNATVKIKIK